MIYLIDDKALRQSKDFGWTAEKLQKHNDVLTPIYDDHNLQLCKSKIFKNGNVIIFHESFYSNEKNKNADYINQELINHSLDKEILTILFSGSNSSRSINKFSATSYPANIYNNLLYFINKYRKEPTSVSANDLLFGTNHFKEKKLILKKEIWELLYRKENGAKVTPKLHAAINKLNELDQCSIEVNLIDIEYLKYKINLNE